MSRPASPDSTRQRSFKRLAELTHLKRENAINILKDEFSIGDSYASTLYASYRTLRKEAGTMPHVYAVVDSKDNIPCKPYMRVQNVLEPKATDCRTPASAKKKYIKSLEIKLRQTKKL